MKKVKYVGDAPQLLPTLGVTVANGDVIDVPDEFSNSNFEDVSPAKKATTTPPASSVPSPTPTPAPDTPKESEPQ